MTCVGIVSRSGDLSAYVGEILKTWGLMGFRRIGPEALPETDPATTPVLLCPASPVDESAGESLLDYARRGGTLFTFLPTGPLAEAAGLRYRGRKAGPFRLRVSEYPASGICGEELPIVGEVGWYDPCARAEDGVQSKGLAYLNQPGRYEDEGVALAEATLGQGRLLAFAFDLPLCVLLLRQGDPAHAERVMHAEGWACTENLGADIGPADCGMVPFADLLARWLVDLVRRYVPLPLPLLWHLPSGESALVLYSGDEDGASVEWVDEELDALTAAGVRMNLYIVPTDTRSTRADVQRYKRHHDVGPHPDLRPLDGTPVAQRVAEFERQILVFADMYGFLPRSVRNHCLAWAGYLDLVEVEARLGIRMDTNYLCCAFMRDRYSGPYHVFGAAMPMRYCWPDGRLIDVFQQHNHLSDDVWFHPFAAKSFRYSPQVYEVLLGRILDDSVARLHMPYGVVIHPSNWVSFSQQQGRVVLQQAAARRIPVWSYDQWCSFWQLRDQWRLESTSWEDGVLTFDASGAADDGNLRWLVPGVFAGHALTEVTVDGEPAVWAQATRYREAVALVALGAGKTRCTVRVTYRSLAEPAPPVR